MAGVHWKGAVFMAVLVFTAWLGTYFFVLPGLLLIFSPATRPLLVKARQLLEFSWFTVITVLIERWGGVKYVFSGAPLPKGESALLISNHRTRLDWMYLWSLCLRTGQLAFLKIVLKAGLKKAPIFGWAMQWFQFIFLNRSWEQDEAYMTAMLQYAGKNRDPLALLIFPEGTDLSEENLAKSRAFAEKSGAAVYSHVLHPRTRGFVHCVQQLRATNAVTAVYDITMGYVDHVEGERPSEQSLLSARQPRAIHVHVTRHALDALPADEKGLAEWVVDRFKEKEARLAKFYADKKYSFDEKSQCATDAPLPMAYALAAVFFGALQWLNWRLWSCCGGSYWLLLAAGTAVFVGLTVASPGIDRLELRYQTGSMPPLPPKQLQPKDGAAAAARSASSKKAD